MVRTARTTAYCVVCLLLTAGAASGQQPKHATRSVNDPLPLFPIEQAWLVTLPAAPAVGGAMDAFRVYVAQSDARLVALDRQTGERLWSRELATQLPPVSAGDLLFVATTDGLHALRAASGDSVWSKPLSRPLRAPALYAGGWLVTPLEGGEIVGLRADDGAEIWRQAYTSTPMDVPVAGEKDAVYLTLEDGRVVAFSITSGRHLWERRLPGTLTPLAWSPGRVFVGSTDNYFYALDAATGAIAWKWRSGGDVVGAAADGDLVFFTSLDNIVRAVNRGNGNQRWRKEITTRPSRPPLAFRRLAVVPGIAPTLSGFAATDGRLTGTWTAPGAVQGEPLIDPDLKPYRVGAVVVMRDGQVAGLYPVSMLFREQAPAPLGALPGRLLAREVATPGAGISSP